MRLNFDHYSFTKTPDRSQETEIITQGQIIAEIVDQCEAAQAGDIFSNIFITAPTGSGKSILFQIPAIYLAEKYNLVTIVVSPLIALMNDQVDQLQRERGISILPASTQA
ncbi:MAG: DEAD/DEAH box helicase [Oscillospiraceae bacterium]